jgi:hypothetical protein
LTGCPEAGVVNIAGVNSVLDDTSSATTSIVPEDDICDAEVSNTGLTLLLAMLDSLEVELFRDLDSLVSASLALRACCARAPELSVRDIKGDT